ncbi:metallophosphoesterase family protein [Deinococcus metallilatus]|uniref:Phosphoesterase n=2 Tax=Deinococcus metallilatus TaxID=1211322 RepID=A0ABR6MU33_9DEIO|nr:metallophosphoesterase family protein [Deinococcus metallilatus]MBB5295179.1 putative phosphoesterase [Deinococcus metallilatus]GMA14952.1 metallophosphoesterase [Deinococcus metallilatus]
MAAMRVAILSDVHGNRFALEAVLADLQNAAPDVICNLGDTVWGGADPAGAWALQLHAAPPTVRGNTDEFLTAAPAELQPRTRTYRAFVERELGGVPPELAALPLTATVAGGEVLLAHGSTNSPWDALFLTGEGEGVRPALPGEMLERVAAWPGVRVVVVGHTHRENIASHRGVTFVNAGSVSRQGHGDPVARWVLLERRAGWWNVTFRRTPYDTEAAARWAEAHAPDGAQEARQLRTGLME